MPLHLPLGAFGAPAQGGALPQHEVHLLLLEVVAARVQNAQRLLGQVRQVVHVRDAGARQHYAWHQVSVYLVLHLLAAAKLHVQVVQLGVQGCVVLNECVSLFLWPLSV